MLEAEASSGSSIMSAFCHHLHTSGEAAAKIVGDLDADGSGQLDFSAFHKFLEKIGISVHEAAAKAAMAGASLVSSLPFSPSAFLAGQFGQFW